MKEEELDVCDVLVYEGERSDQEVLGDLKPVLRGYAIDTSLTPGFGLSGRFKGYKRYVQWLVQIVCFLGTMI